jgi:hypothetical protein
MSIEDIKMLAAYMTVHSDDEKEHIAIGHSLVNKVVGNMNGMSDMPALDEEMKKEFFDLINNAPTVDKDEEDAYKRNLIIAGAIQSGRIKDPTGGATDFSKEKVDGTKVLHETKNYKFHKPQEAEVMASQTKSPRGRKTKKV